MADIISRLKLESGEFDSKIKRAGQELMAYSEHCRKTGLEMGYANKDAKDFAKALGNMQTTSTTARGKISELSDAFVNLRVMYKNMTDEEKNNQFGKNLAASLDQLKTRIQDAKKDLADVQQELSGSKFGQFGSILDGIGQKMGLNANITELLTSKTALMSAGIGAAGAIIAKATQEWAKYNAELAKQDQITTVTTGLKGPDSDRMTNQARALTDTYGVDFREAINAANTLMTQFGQTGEQAMSLISDGMQGMIQGDGPKLLSMIQQYAPAFRDAGVTASQLVAVIQNSEGGIFTDQNMNAIVMGIKNIRLMTKDTSDALAQLGIDGQKMSQQLSDGSMTIFDALKQVATQIQGVNSNSQAAGEVMQQVFGRQGAMAGTKLGEAIATLNTNLEETKRQTGEVGDAYNDLYNANVKLNGAIRDCFEYDGWDQMATGIKSSLVSALASVIEKLATIKQFLTGMSANDYLKQMGGSDKVNRMIGMLGNGQDKARNTYDRQVGAFEAYINPRKKYLENLDAWRRGNRSDDVKAEVEWGRNKFGIDDRAIRNSVKAAESQLEEYQKKAEQVFSNVNKKSGEINIDLTGGNKGGNKGGTTTTRTAATPKTEEQQNTARIAELVKQYQDLATAAKTANDAQKAGLTERMAKIQGEITSLQDRNAELKKFADEARHVQYPVGSLPQLNEQLKTLQAEQSKALDATQWKDYQQQIEQTQYQIDALKGKWQDGLQATFKINIEQQGNTDINTAKPEDISVTFRADDADVLAKVRDIEGITIDPKTLTVTANTAEAYNKVQELLKSVDGKTVTFAVQPKMDTGTSIQSDAGMSAYIASLKQQLETADYGTSLYNGLSAQLADMTTLQNLVGESLKAGLGTAMFDVADEIGADFWTRAMEGGVDNIDWQTILDKINEARKAARLDAISLDFTTGSITNDKGDKNGKRKKNQFLHENEDGKQEAKMLEVLGGLTGGMQQMIGGLEQLGIDIPAGLQNVVGGIQLVSTILTSIMTIVSAIEAISAADAIIPFANGGIVPKFADGGLIGRAAGGMMIPGNSYSGDNLRLPVDGERGMIGVNSGELILNKSSQNTLAASLLQAESLVDSINDYRVSLGSAQQMNLASQLEGGGMQNLNLTATIKGEDIKLALNNNSRRTGRGEYVTTRFK